MARYVRRSSSSSLAMFAVIRVMSWTPAEPLRARMRERAVMFDFVNPARPGSGALAGDGKQGSIMPNPGRVRSGNDIGEI